jgi:hypothetical protein
VEESGASCSAREEEEEASVMISGVSTGGKTVVQGSAQRHRAGAAHNGQRTIVRRWVRVWSPAVRRAM